MPKACLEEISAEIGIITEGLVVGNVADYDGAMYSTYEKKELMPEAIALFGKGKVVKNIQEDLGQIDGPGKTRLEFFLTAPSLKKYKCRLMFLEYGMGGYPVTIVMEYDIARELREADYILDEYILRCKDMEDFQYFLNSVIATDYVRGIMQSIITESLLKKETQNKKKK